jgi:predicted MFS family arabinose efflux permease
MISVITGDPQHRVDINSRQSIVAIVYLAVVGPCVFILQPGFVQGLVAHLGLSEQQAGLIASAEMFGLAATTVLLSFVSTKVTWRKFTMICLFICVLGNLASLGQSDFNTLRVIRFITGLGSGGIISLTFTMMGLTERSDRNFGYIVVWVLTYGAFGLLLMPQAYATVGMNGVLVFFAAFCALGLVFVKHLPDSGDHVETTAKQVHFSTALKGISLAAILSYNIGIGIVWAYLFLVGLEAGMGEQAVANALTVSQFLGIAGAFLAVLFEVRLGRLLPLAIGILGGAASIYYLVGDIGSTEYWIAVCGFNFLWNLSMPYLLATLADFDHRGRIVVHGVSMQFIGYAVGPAIAARLLGFGYDVINTTAVVLFVAAALLLLPGVMAQHDGLKK